MDHRLSYKRVLLKISGEALQGSQAHRLGVDYDFCADLAYQIQGLCNRGVQVAIVVGAGNFFRGAQGSLQGLERTSADYVGMLATMMNGLILQDIFKSIGSEACLMSALNCQEVTEYYRVQQALRHLEEGKIVIFSGGTGNPFFTTDTAAALRASEIQADLLMKATKVDGVYDKDPLKYPEALKYDKLTYSTALAERLKVMDLTAITMCMENNIPIFVFNIFAEKGIAESLSLQQGTIVKGE
ncbi:MAG: UMP kinase [Chlamydiota bacterium]